MLAGYITAQRVDLARVQERVNQLYLYEHETYNARDFSDFNAILTHYTKRHPGDISVACLGVAGPVFDNEVTGTNLPWTLKGSSLERKFSLRKVRVINDVVAAARGLFVLGKEKFFMLNEGNAQRQANIGLLAPGAGLGEAIISYDGDKYTPHDSEGGHAGFAPVRQIETELWEYVYGQKGFVEAEDIISLAGLETIFRFLLERERAIMPDWFKKAPDKPSAVIEKGLSAKDDTAVHTLELFVRCFANEASSLALKGMTLGGVYLSGVIAPQLITVLDQGRFMLHFTGRGKMASVLNDIPVAVILDDRTALLGAASMALRL